MSIEMPALPFDKKSLTPHISEETIEFHYGKHHHAYVDKLNLLIADTEFEQKSLLEIIRASHGGIFNNAAQVYNHDFYWHCLSNDKGDKTLSPEFDEALNLTFGGIEKFNAKGSTFIFIARETIRAPQKSNEIRIVFCSHWDHFFIPFRTAHNGIDNGSQLADF